MNIRTLALFAAALSTSLGTGAIVAPPTVSGAPAASTSARVRTGEPTTCAAARVASVAELQAADAALPRDLDAAKTSSVDGTDVGPFTTGESFRAANFFDARQNYTPDMSGDVGPTQILVAVNGRIRVFDKAGNLGDLDVTGFTFWDTQGYFASDQQQIRYDPSSSRWFVAGRVNYGFGLAVSDGPEITERTEFTFYEFLPDAVGPDGNLDTNGFPTWPTLGIDKNAVYIGADIYRQSPQVFGPTLFVIRKSSALAGTALVATAFRLLGDDGFQFYAPVAVSNDDPNATDGFFIGSDTKTYDRLRVLRIADPGGVPQLVADSDVEVPIYRPTGAISISLLGSDKPITPGVQRLTQARVTRDLTTGASTLWTSIVTAVGSNGVADVFADRSAVRWYQVGDLAGQPRLVQSGTAYDAGVGPRGFTTPSVVMTGQGHAVLGFSGGSAATHSQIYLSTRLAGDPAGTMRGPEVALTSDVTYNPYTPQPNATQQVWGTYSTTTLDSGDAMTVWTLQPYVDGTDAWAVRVIEVKAPAPAAVASLAPSTLPLGSTTEVVVSGVSTDGTGFFDPGEGHARRLAASVAGEGVTVESVRYVDPTHVAVTISVAASAPTGARDVTIANPDGQSVTATGALAIGPGVTGVRVTTNASGATQLVIDGTGLVAASTVSVDGVAFAKAPKLKNGSLVQKGKLVSGASINRAIPKGATVEIEVTSGGGTTRFAFTRPA